MEKNFKLQNLGRLADFLGEGENKGKYFAGKALGLSGCEISLNRLAPGEGTPFVHAHKKNEELYIILSGQGRFFVDGEEFPVKEGSLIRVAPAGERGCCAGDEELYFICIQAQVDSLEQATLHDGIVVTTKASWMNGD